MRRGYRAPETVSAAVNELRLLAQDEEDLKIVSAHLQDAYARIGDIGYLPKAHRFAMLLDRFCWECGAEEGSRRRVGLHLDGVLKVRTQGIDQTTPDEMLTLLAIDFLPGKEGEGAVDFLFLGGERIRLEVECIDATMTDIAEPWPASPPPPHELEPQK